MRAFFLLSSTVVLLCCTISWVGCSASNGDLKRGNDEGKRGRWDEAVVYYQRALDRDPDNIEFRMALQRARLEVSHLHAKLARNHIEAEETERAVQELEVAAEYDPTNKWVRDELAVLYRRLEEGTAGGSSLRAAGSTSIEMQAVLDPSSAAPIRLKFAEGTSLRKVLEALSKLAGVNILFDESFRDKTVTVDLVDVSFQEALDILTRTNGLFYKVIRPSAVQVGPDNAPQQ